ncbi:MAG: DNA primase [Tepidisphaeraceae bacterium]|jgi:DNA primase
MEMRPSGPSSSRDNVTKVLQATDIVELIGRTVALKRRGKDFVGLCPFHQEKTPSFKVSAAGQYFYCFGCKKGGDAIEFVKSRDRVEFSEALRILAEAAGIELAAYSGKQNAGERQTLLEANSAACLFFEKLLSHPQHGLAAREYLSGRGFDEASIKRFRIGLAVDQWDALLNSPGMKKFSPRHLALAGLAKPRERGDGYYDTFRNRLMFPIRDESGRVIAFGGRVMPGSDDPAKYLNSPETPLFSKSRSVFGLDLARGKIVETRTVAVVEGYTDVIMAHQFGAGNVVSVLGTALTEQHVGLLRRLADRIVLLFDADAAGEAAVNRAVELFLTQPVEIAIASLPDGLDPDEFLLQRGPEAFSQLVSGAQDALAYKWRQLDRQVKAGDSLTARQQAVEQYLTTLAGARGSGPVDPIRWGAALARVSRLTEIPVEQLSRRFKVKSPPRRARTDAQVAARGEPNINAPSPVPTARQNAEGFIIGLLLLEPEHWDRVQQGIAPAEFTEEGLRRIAEVIWRRQEDEGAPVFSEFLNLLEEAELKSLAVRWVEEASNTPDAQATLDGCLRHLAEVGEREKGRQLIAQLRRTGIESTGKAEDLSADVQALRQLQERARARSGVPIV